MKIKKIVLGLFSGVFSLVSMVQAAPLDELQGNLEKLQVSMVALKNKLNDFSGATDPGKGLAGLKKKLKKLMAPPIPPKPSKNPSAAEIAKAAAEKLAAEEKVKAEKESAATRIQKAFRIFSAKKQAKEKLAAEEKVKAEKKEKEDAVTKIGAVYKGYKARKKLKDLKAEKAAAEEDLISPLFEKCFSLFDLDAKTLDTSSVLQGEVDNLGTNLEETILRITKINDGIALLKEYEQYVKLFDDSEREIIITFLSDNVIQKYKQLADLLVEIKAILVKKKKYSEMKSNFFAKALQKINEVNKDAIDGLFFNTTLDIKELLIQVIQKDEEQHKWFIAMVKAKNFGEEFYKLSEHQQNLEANAKFGKPYNQLSVDEQDQLFAKTDLQFSQFPDQAEIDLRNELQDAVDQGKTAIAKELRVKLKELRKKRVLAYLNSCNHGKTVATLSTAQLAELKKQRYDFFRDYAIVEQKKSKDVALDLAYDILDKASNVVVGGKLAARTKSSARKFFILKVTAKYHPDKINSDETLKLNEKAEKRALYNAVQDANTYIQDKGE